MSSSRSSSVTLILSSALALALAACGGKGAARPQPAAAVPYAGVFVARPAATYHYVSKSSMYDPDDARADANGQVVDQIEATVSCATVTRTVGAWQLAEITCTGAADAGQLAQFVATFAASPTAIWRLTPDDATDDAGLAVVAARPPLLVAQPVPVDDKHEEEGGAFGEFRKVHADGAAWCVETGAWGGDEGGEGICFEPARGITKVTTYFAGGMTKDESLELVP